MYQRILCPTDGSRRAEHAAGHALSIARRADATLHLLHVIDTSLIDVRALKPEYQVELKVPGNRAMDSISTVSNELGVQTRRTIMQGVPRRGIIRYIDDYDIDLVAMGRRGMTTLETVLLGGVSEAVVSQSSCPVITVNGEATLSSDLVDSCDYDRILIATDGSSGVTAAADNAIWLADAYDAEVHVLFVLDERATLPYPRGEQIEQSVKEQLNTRGKRATREIADRARASHIPVSESVETGIPSRSIQRYADENDIDLIALGRTGRSGLQQTVLGSVADRVVKSSSVPVLTARVEKA